MSNYANDFNQKIGSNNDLEMLTKVNRVIIRRINYCNLNKLKINGDKNVPMRLTMRQKPQVNGQEIIK